MANRGMINIVPANNVLLPQGWIMDYGDRKETFSYTFSFLCFHYYRDGGNFSYN